MVYATCIFCRYHNFLVKTVRIHEDELFLGTALLVNFSIRKRVELQVSKSATQHRYPDQYSISSSVFTPYLTPYLHGLQALFHQLNHFYL